MQEVDILKEINKDAKMGMDSINMVSKKVTDDKFQKILDEQHNEYQNIFDRTQELLIQENSEIQDVPAMQKAMAWTGIQMNTMNDKSNSKLSELLIQGNDMGVIKGTKLLNDYSFTTPEIKNLLSDFIRLQKKTLMI